MPHVLIVDDEQSVLHILGAFMSKMGYEVLTANGADEAFQHFFGNNFDLVILDIHMPGKDGFQIAKEMRLTRPQQKIVIITGLDAGQVFKHLTSNDCDFDDILYKPFTYDKIKEVISQVMKN